MSKQNDTTKNMVLAALMLVACFASCTTPDAGNEDTTAGSNASAELAGTYDITMKLSVPSNMELDKVTSQIKILKNVVKVVRQ